MNLRLNKAWAAGIGAALVVAAATGAVAADWEPPTAEDAAAWYSADDEPDEVDPDRAGTLGFVGTGGDPVTGGELDEPLAAYAVAPAAIRAGDDHATLYAYLPDGAIAAAAWTGVQVSGTGEFPIDGAPAGVGTKPAYALDEDDLVLADLVEAYPSPTDVYEIRLRTSSAANGVGVGYASAYVEVNESAGTWELAEGPGTGATPTTTTLQVAPSSGVTLGNQVTLTATVSPAAAGTVTFGDGATDLTPAVTVVSGQASKQVTVSTTGNHAFKATFTPSDSGAFAGSASSVVNVNVGASAPTITGTWPARATYGKPFNVTATVKVGSTPSTGTVSIKLGSKTLVSKALSGGTATLTVPATAVAPGSRALTLAYGGSPTVSSGSVSKTLVVDKAKATVKAATAKTISRTANGKVTVTVTAPGVVPTGLVTVYDGKKAIAKGTLTAARKGKITITLPKLKKGTHQIKVVYGGSTYVLTATSSTIQVTSR